MLLGRWIAGSRLRQGFAGPRTHSAAEALAKAASPAMTIFTAAARRVIKKLVDHGAGDPPHIHLSNSLKDTTSRSRGAKASGSLREARPRKLRGRRECRMLAAPASLACKESALYARKQRQGSRNTRHSLRNGFNGCFVLSLVYRAC
jgi:hypothetical protein